MKLDCNKADLISFLKSLQQELGIDTSMAVSTIPGVLNFTLKGVEIKQKLKVGSVSMTLELSATEKGAVSINIVGASFSGLSLFGVVKTKARDLIMGVLAGYSKYFSTMVLPTGQIIIARPGVEMRQVLVGEDRVVIVANLT